MKHLLTAVAAAAVMGLAVAGFSLATGTTAQDRDAERIAALETRVADLSKRLTFTRDQVNADFAHLSAGMLPPPVPAADLGYWTARQAFTEGNTFRLVCRVGELNTLADLTCIRATFP